MEHIYWLAGGLLAMFGALATLDKGFDILKKWKGRASAPNEQQNARLDALEQDNVTIKAEIASLRNRTSALETCSAAQSEGTMALLHDRLYQCCEHYLTKGSIDVGGLNNINRLYKAYEGLGGNGTGKMLYDRVQELPIDNGK